MGIQQKIVDVTLTVDTSAYTAGDVLADTALISNALFDVDTTAVLMSLQAIDEADQGVAMDIYFLSANSAFGTINGAPSLSDAGARDILGKVSIATGDWKDLGGVRVAYFSNLWIPLKPATGTRNIYVAVVNGSGTPTFGAATDLKLRLGLSRDV